VFGHKALVSSYEKRISSLTEAHYAHVASLEAHIEDLKRLVYPTQNYMHPTLDQMEADAILSVKETVIELTEEEQKRRSAEISERDRILSGTY
jgi:hypothetical protein